MDVSTRRFSLLFSMQISGVFAASNSVFLVRTLSVRVFKQSASWLSKNREYSERIGGNRRICNGCFHKTFFSTSLDANFWSFCSIGLCFPCSYVIRASFHLRDADLIEWIQLTSILEVFCYLLQEGSTQ
ncbi:uncharacterized protein LOC111453965 [Cucurbita moschata]|uniref:Uncharacterized protein LOC111453965 n=1 Tax=Cucurbita moschata TaxID=3662 RepID=A0A6J1GGB0_CUCMO|nr:uncharacterized protein LOC111453965 [Cucurbita moschata]